MQVEKKSKICSKCKVEKLYSEFYKHKQKPDGYSYLCKDCENKTKHLYERNNKEKIKEAYNRDKEKRNTYLRVRWSRRKQLESEKHYKSTYGVFWECRVMCDEIDKEIIKQVPDKKQRNKLRVSYQRHIDNLVKRKKYLRLVNSLTSTLIHA